MPLTITIEANGQIAPITFSPEEAKELAYLLNRYADQPNVNLQFSQPGGAELRVTSVTIPDFAINVTIEAEGEKEK